MRELLQGIKMNNEYETILQKIHDSGKQNRELYKKIKRMKEAEVTKLFNSLHDHFFCQFNCIDCANCCKALGPRLNNHDIDRMAKHFGMKRGSFLKNYVIGDEDGDNVFKQMPCPFLLEDNHCLIYDIRPKACREFPHTDEEMKPELLNFTFKNANVCPSVAAIITELKNRL